MIILRQKKKSLGNFINISFIACAITSISCGEPALYINIESWPDNAVKIFLRTSLQEQNSDPYEITYGTKQLIVKLPTNAAGTVTLSADALNQAGCTVATSELVEEVPSGVRRWAERALIFAAKTPPDCANPDPTKPITPAAGPDSWRWQHPQFPAHTLNAVWVASQSNVWAVGVLGTILHWDGAQLTATPSGTIETLNGIWGSSANDIWAVGEHGTRLHWDGAKWNPVPGQPNQSFSAIWGSSSNNVWLGQYGPILRWNGTSWEEASSGVANYITSISGVSSSDIWAVSRPWKIYHWNGNTWTNYSGTLPPMSSISLGNVWARASNDAWITDGSQAVLRWDGSNWRARPPLPMQKNWLIHIWGASANEVYTMFNNGIEQWNGTGWTLYPVPQGAPRLNGLSGSGMKNIWTVGEGSSVLQFNGTSWNNINIGKSGSVREIWGNSKEDIWAVGDGGLALHSTDGKGWSTTSLGTNDYFTGIWGSAANDVWVVGSSDAYHWDGRIWTASGLATSLAAIWGSSSADIWALGRFAAKIYHWNGAEWSSDKYVPRNELYKIWGSGANDVWAVGAQGIIVHWDGAQWLDRSFSSDYDHDIRAIGGLGAGQVWIGRNREIFAYAASGWIIEKTPGIGSIYAIRGSGSDVRAVGSSGMIMRRKVDELGKAYWEKLESGTLNNLYTIWSADTEDIWAGGDFGTILHR